MIALLSDFGTTGWYVACMKGVILARCPQARLVDMTHEIPSYDVRAGAFALAAAAPWFPNSTIFACVVDPGVGTRRALLAAQADQRLFVGPDNGLLSLVFQRAKRLSLVQLTNRRYWQPQVSHTFHGRDIIAPVAAYLAAGGTLRQLGPVVKRYERLAMPTIRHTAAGFIGAVVFIDEFGNLITNFPSTLLERRTACRLWYKGHAVRVVSAYQEGRPGELVAVPASSGYVELAVSMASAARRYHARRDDRVELRATS